MKVFTVTCFQYIKILAISHWNFLSYCIINFGYNEAQTFQSKRQWEKFPPKSDKMMSFKAYMSCDHLDRTWLVFLYFMTKRQLSLKAMAADAMVANMWNQISSLHWRADTKIRTFLIVIAYQMYRNLRDACTHPGQHVVAGSPSTPGIHSVVEAALSSSS